jgi:hypothetical protein
MGKDGDIEYENIKTGASKREPQKIDEKWGTKYGNIEFNINSSPLF